jgi:two-component system OmpR family response regulator
MVLHPASSILVVDPDTQVRRLVERILDRAGFEVVGAGNGREAMSAMSSRGFDGFVLDAALDEAFDLAAALASRGSRMGIITTAGADLRHRCWPVLQKPFNPARLLSLLAPLRHERI